MKLLVAFLLLFVPVSGYMYLTGAGVDELSTKSLRGLVPGNLWNPPEDGANRIPCGGKGNAKNTILPREEENTVGVQFVSAGSTLRIVGKLTVRDIADGLEQSYVDVQIKYGNSPNFQMNRGYRLGEPFAPTESGYFQLLAPIPTAEDADPAYNGNATIQVSYAVSRNKTYYQCIDVIITDGKPFPKGDYPWGKGPDDTHVDVVDAVTGLVPEEDSGFLTALIILLVLICIAIGIAIYCIFASKNNLPKDTPVPDPIEHQEVPKEPEKPAQPVAATPPKEDSDNEPIGHVMYTPAEESDPTPQESSEQKSLDATGSQGRHFHFRYVEEDDDDGAKEDVV